ncbi:MAG: IS21 family transposase [Thermoleophilia bacterium]|nr:IS21 family transposase [Thermoleophilia bacterium]
MRKIREILRLVIGEGLSRRQATAATGLPYTTVADHLARAERAGLGWPLPADLDDARLEARLFAKPEPPPSAGRPLPDWRTVHRELRRKGVTLQLLHMEYKADHPDGYQYTQFCRLYRSWQGRLDLVMRQEHRAGEKLFVDWAGATIPITDPATGEVWQASLFVAVLGASSYTYVEAFASQALPDWISGHVHAFTWFEGSPAIVVPDNPRTAVVRAHRYEPDLQRTYEEMAAHYRCAIIPARPSRPRDKAKAEAGVLVATRWVVAALRHRTFLSLAEANVAIRERLDWLNRRPFRKLPGSRRELWETLDRPALRPLPSVPYEYATWKTATVNIDYHVEVDRHWYSVPYQLVGQVCDVRVTTGVVEVLHRGHRVASHPRSARQRSFTTDHAHMPESHRRHAEWTPGRIVAWAERTGPSTAALVTEVMASRPHPEQGFRSCLGIMRLGQRYGDARLEAACARALAVRALSYRSVESILKAGLDALPLPGSEPVMSIGDHANVRGPGYYE